MKTIELPLAFFVCLLTTAGTAVGVAPPLPFVAVAPCRQYDSRASTVLLQNTPRTVLLTGAPCGIPAGAQAVALNITIFNITGAASNGVFSVGVTAPPPTAWINYPPTETQRGNAGVVGLTGAGEIIVQVNQVAGSIDFVVDVFGYYAPQGIVSTLNALSGDVTLSAGTNVTITPTGNTLTIDAAAGGGPPSGPAGGGLSGSYPNPTVVSTSLPTPNTVVSRDGAGSFQATDLFLGGSLWLFDGCASVPVIRVGGDPFLTLNNCQQNTFVGRNAGQPTSAGVQNSAYGNFALDAIASGSYNSAFGAFALLVNTSGSYNSAFGLNALRNNTTGSHNTAIGPDALSAQTFGNAGFGWGGYNTAVGTGALANSNPTNMSNGIHNTAVGAYSLLWNSTGFNNTAMGVNAAATSVSKPGYGGGSVQLHETTTGDSNTFIGHEVGATSGTISNCTAVGADAYCDGNDQVRLGNASVVSIGGKVAWSTLSDARAKKDVRDLDVGLDFVLSLRPVEYRLRLGNGRVDMGFLAQDIEKVLGDDYNVVTVGGDPARTLSLRYTDLIAPVVKAIQEQEEQHWAQLDARDARIAELERRLAALEEGLTPR